MWKHSKPLYFDLEYYDKKFGIQYTVWNDKHSLLHKLLRQPSYIWHTFKSNLPPIRRNLRQNVRDYTNWDGYLRSDFLTTDIF